MARRQRQAHKCRRCGDARLEDETFYGNLCPACSAVAGRRRRAQAGARVLARAEDAGTVDQDGKTYTLLTLPAKRRGGRRRR